MQYLHIISAHSNVKIFITHGGLLSTLEAIHFGKPVIGIPAYGDQHLNAAKMETMGIGFKLAFASLAEEKIYEAITKILNDPIYDKNAKDLSKRFTDRPRSPLDEATFWIEYVIRHKGAKFMKSPLLQLNFYESYMLDVILVIITLLITPIFILIKIMSYVCGSKKIKNEQKNGKNKRE